MTKRKHPVKLQAWRALNKKPIRYELVKMLFESGVVQVGWWDGSKWDNRKGVSGNVVAWKIYLDKYDRS